MQLPGKQMQYYPSAVLFLNISRAIRFENKKCFTLASLLVKGEALIMSEGQVVNGNIDYVKKAHTE